MWPRWMPSVASARSAARFDARPAAPITIASVFASVTPSSRWPRRAPACACSVPPTVPTAIGISSRPGQVVALARATRPAAGSARSAAANACAPASTPRQSLPVAITTASTPFMIPLLCVAARYGSSSANSDAATMPSRTASPSSASVASALAGTRASTRTQAPVAQVGQDAQPGPPARQPRRLVGQRLGDGVDHVGPHRVLAVDVHVQDDAPRMRAHLQRARPAAAIGQARQRRVRQRQQLLGRRFQPRLRRRRIVDADDLDLRGHDRVVGVRGEAAALAHHARGVRRRRDHRRLLDRHRHQVVAGR